MNSAKTLTMSLAVLLLLGSPESTQAFRLSTQGRNSYAYNNLDIDSLNQIEQDIAKNQAAIESNPSRFLVAQDESYGADGPEEDSDDYSDDDDDFDIDQEVAQLVDGLENDPARQQKLMQMLEGHKEASNVKKGIQELQSLNSQMVQQNGEPKDSAKLLQS